MKKSIFAALFFVCAIFVAGTALSGDANEGVRDISWSEQYCCVKAGCPEGSYACRFFGQLFGGTCTRKVSNLPVGLEGNWSEIRNSCMGATFSWWSGVTCPSTCRDNNDSTD